MRIALRNSSVLYPLAGQAGVSEREHSSAADLQIAPAIIIQTDARLRAPVIRHRDRLNLSTVISFSTTRAFPSVREAEIWARRYDGDFPRTGDLVCDSIDPVSALTYRDEYADAVVEPPTRTLIGATVFLRYTVRAGAVTEIGQVETIPNSIDVSGCDFPLDLSGTYTKAVSLVNGRPSYSKGSYVLAWTGTAWNLSRTGDLYYSSTENAPHPVLVSEWITESIAEGTLSIIQTP